MKKRVYSFEWLRVISCFAVVILHACALAVSSFAADAGVNAGVMVLRNLMMFAVPCFVMTTGALLLDPQRDLTIEKTTGKYLKRTVVVLIVFTLIFSIYDGITGRTGFIAVIKDWLKNLYTGGSWLHMWYLYLLIAVYLSLPLLKKITDHLSEKERKYALIVLLIFLSVVPTLNTITRAASGFYILFYSIYPFYLLIGNEIHQRHIVLPLWLSVVLAAGGALCIAIMSYEGIMRNSTVLISLSSNYASVPVVCEGIGIFSLMERHDFSRSKIIHQLDKLTFGIYLVHVIFLKVLYGQIGYNPLAGSFSIVLLILISAVVFMITALTVLLLRKIRIVRKYL